MAKIRLAPGSKLVCAGCLVEYDPRLEAGETGGAKIAAFARRHRSCRETSHAWCREKVRANE